MARRSAPVSGPGPYSVTPRLGGARSEAANPHTSTRLSLSPPGLRAPGSLCLEGPPLLASTPPPPSSLYPGHPVLFQEAFPDMSYQAGEGTSFTSMKALISLS